jgi:hypothetical protein
MEETSRNQTTTGSASSSESASHRHPVRGRVWELEGRWLMGRAGPGEMLEGVGRYLRLETPERRDELLAAIRTRAKKLEEADKDLPVDGPSTGMLALTSTVLAAYETLLPVFDGDQRRTILFLQHVLDAVARRPFEIAFEVPGKREDPLGAIEAACRKEASFYGSYFDIAFDRQDADTFEMRAERCFFRAFFARHGNTLFTTVVCAWDANWMRAVDPDANWMRAVDPAVGGLRAERTSLMSLGDDACRFRVVRTDDPLAPYADELHQRFSGGQATG